MAQSAAFIWRLYMANAASLASGGARLREQLLAIRAAPDQLPRATKGMGGGKRGPARRPGGSAMFHLRVFCLAVAIAIIGGAGHVHAQGTVQTQPIDPFGLEVTLPEKPIIFATGTGEWDTAYETLVEAFKTVKAYLDKAGIKATGPAMTIYTEMDDVSFTFQAAFPIAAAPSAAPPANLGAGMSPGGRALKFVHRGPFDVMTQTYDAISHHVEEKQIATKELLIEEYVTDVISTANDKLVINIFVPLEVAKGP